MTPIKIGLMKNTMSNSQVRVGHGVFYYMNIKFKSMKKNYFNKILFVPLIGSERASILVQNSTRIGDNAQAIKNGTSLWNVEYVLNELF